MRRFSSPEILRILREVARTRDVEGVLRRHGVTRERYDRWRVRAAELRKSKRDGDPQNTADQHGPGGATDQGLREPELVDNDNFPHTPHHLFHLQIGVTYACPCKCAHCGVSQQRNRPGILTTDEIVDLCRQARQDLGGQVVELFGGEPLYRPEIREIVAGCAEHLDVWMSSNGLRMDREMARDLAARGLKRIFLSLDSCVPEKHDRNRNTPGCFEAVMRAVDHCCEFGIEANFSTCAMADLIITPELEALIELTRRSGAHQLRLVLPKMIGKLAGNEEILLKADEIEQIRQITAREEIVYVEAEGNRNQHIEKCFCLRGHVYVNPWGVVQPCVYTLLDYGNVREQPLSFLYRRMFEHRIFADKSLLNLCLLQNTEFVAEHLAELSDDNPLVKINFEE